MERIERIMTIPFQCNDGGREGAGYKGSTGDCFTRALALATGISYQEAYDLVNAYGKKERRTKRRGSKSSARTGVYKATCKRILTDMGWVWTPTMFIGSGCKVHLNASELPTGTILCSVSKHWVAVINGVLHDTHDCSRKGTRSVYGYFKKGN